MSTTEATEGMEETANGRLTFRCFLHSLRVFSSPVIRANSALFSLYPLLTQPHNFRIDTRRQTDRM